MRILLVDDHEVVREGLRNLLTTHPDIEVAGEAGDGASAIRRVGYDSPDVVVLDVRLPDMSGVEACRSIIERFPDVKVVMLSAYADEEAITEAIRAGASGYLVKQLDGSPARGCRAADRAGGERRRLDRDRAALRPHSRRSQAVPARRVERARAPHPRPHRRRLTNREIADEIYLAEKTVKNHVSRILGKLGFHNRSEAAAYIARMRRSESDALPPEEWAT
jgi:two-component system, NarL family, response regulator DevR